MALLKCPVLCHSEEDSQSHSIHCHSQSSTFSSLSSQPSLPSVHSVTPPSPSPSPSSSSSSHHQLIITLKGHSSHISSLVLYSKFLYSAFSNGEIRASKRDLFADQTSGNTNNLVAFSNGAIKSLVILGNNLFSAHQNHKIRVWKIDNNIPNHKFNCIATLPIFSDKTNSSPPKNYIEIRRHKEMHMGACDQSILVWEAKNGGGDSNMVLVGAIRGHTKAILCLAAKEVLVCSGSADNTVRIWRGGIDKSYSCLAVVEGHTQPV
ncbi:myosin heavy chain kinase B-like [Quillaja saponaria]|uniref:Myosin heavy chain kinase B-like n=1 Tax=Quillaja saponaria TaxID=32244 RepID=A0AAD7KPF2_QUISA|nr:myosin heavy chain kinase B-like [Quillaja saponaria]